MRIQKSVLLFAIVGFMLPATVFAAGSREEGEFPQREIRLIVPYSAGGASDQTARQIAAIVDREGLLDEPIVVTNMPGAGTARGLREVANANPDGHTLLLHHNVFITMELLGLLDEEITWDVGFAPVAQVLETPLTIAVLDDSPWQTMDDLVQDIQANPGEISLGFPGVGSPQSFGFHALLNAYEEERGTELDVHAVYFEGGAEIRSAHFAGEIDVVPGISMDTVPDAQAGEYRILAVGTEDRLPSLPEVPTIEEAGLPMPVNAGGQSLRMSVWAPAGTPDAVINQLSGLLEQVVATDDWKKFADDVAGIPRFRGPEGLREVFQSDEDALRPVVEVLRAQE